MRRFQLKWASFLLLCSLIFPQSLTARELVVLTGEWKPFVSSDLENDGFLAEVVQKAFETVDIETVVQFAPWPRCEAAIRHGKEPVTFPYTETVERSAFALFSDTIATSRTVFFYNRKKMKPFRYTGLDQLEPFLVGGIRGYFYLPRLKKAGLNIDYSENEEDAIKKLFYGRVDLVLLNELVGWNIINTTYSGRTETFDVFENAYDTNDLRLMASKNHPDGASILKGFNKGLRIIKSNGVYRRILEKFDIPETAGHFDSKR